MDEAVLVLNANFEPIHVCTLRRAVNMMLAEKATLVVNGRGEIKTVSASFPRPSVIRLARMVPRPRPRINISRKEIFRRDNYTCQYCGKRVPDLTVDHVIPRHLGGQHIWVNVVTACSSCNHRKGGRTVDEANLHLLRVPREPPVSAYYLFSSHLHLYTEWEPFLLGW
jgi:5-methylcytosine-specific restriction endonuclease McrA